MIGQRILTPRQKAAVIVRLMLDEGVIQLSALDAAAQTALAQEMASMDLIDRVTRDAVINEFCDSLESVGVIFPGDLNGTLEMLGGALSEDSTQRLRRIAALTGRGDPWVRLADLPVEKIITLANQEAVEVVALLLSKLHVAKASQAFTALGPERARAVAHAMSMTGGVSAESLLRVGQVLLNAAEALPRPAIEKPAVDRVGAILNFTTTEIREKVLEGLDEDDAKFAGDVRKAIFTYAHIRDRVEPRDVPRVVREVDNQMLMRALAGASGDYAATSEFILNNISQRLAENLREDLGTVGRLRTRDIEEAMTQVVTAVRSLVETGEIKLIQPDDEEEAAA